MKKKLLSLLMAVAMVLSLAVPAFAAGGTAYWTTGTQSDSNIQTVTFEARTFVPTIKLSIPNITADPMILNPYKIEYTGGTPAATLNTVAVHSADATSQIICPIYAIKNETNAKMNVQVAATTTVGSSELSLVSTHVALTESTKKALINLVVQKVSTNSAPGSANGVHIDNSQAMTKLDAYDTANNTVIAMSSSGNTAQQVAQLANGATTPNYLLFQFDGELSRTPTTAWKEADKIKTVLTFTFTPASAPDARATVNNSTVFGNNALSKESLAATSNDKTIELPKMGSTGIDNQKFTTFVKDPSDYNYTLTLNAADPAWEIVDKGPFTGMTKAGDASSGYSVKIPGADLDKLPKDGAAHDYKFILGFKDKNGVPRTVEVTANITRQYQS